MDLPRGVPSTPRRRRVIDRFIPHREGVDLSTAFSVSNSVRQPAPNLFGTNARPDQDTAEDWADPTDIQLKESREAHQMYSNLLKSEMFGADASPGPSRDSSASIGSAGVAGGPSGLGGSMGSAYSGANLPASSVSMDSISSMSSSDLSVGLSPDRSAGRLSSRSRTSLPGMSPSYSSLSLPTSPRKRREQPVSTNMLRYSPKKLLRSTSDLSDISAGGMGGTLRPESREYLLQPKPRTRAIPQTPYKVLDAPLLADDFYLNLVDWGSSDQLAVGLSNHVYVWSASSGSVVEVADLGRNNMVTSVSWMNTGEHIAVGSSHGEVMIYDVVARKKLRTMGGHDDRASSLAWNDHILSTGSRDHTILHRDCRIKDHFISRVEGHRGEVCGLKWNTDLQQLASGSNDNKLKIWNGVGSQEPLFEFDEHTSAVKGLAWSPHQRGLLASAGGFCDRKIWFWNTLTGKSVSSIDTGSQVCNLEWNPRVKELVSSHNNRWNDIVVWRYPTMQPVTRLRGHAFRVLHMAMSPDGRSLATGAGDETLRLWSLYDEDRVEEERSVLDMYQQLR